MMQTLKEFDKAEIRWQYSLLKKSRVSRREHGEVNYNPREAYHRDYTRVLYSPSFRRLQGKMQILGIEPSAFFRNRLTHSLEVSQIAHSIALNVGLACDRTIYQDDLFLIDAAALAHDIGHPAFGHKGEKVLDKLAGNFNSRFEGNAQNFRVLRTLEKKEPTIQGLNLTNRTLLAINKYIVREGADEKKFMFADDYDYLNDVRASVGLQQRRTLDVQIIELADDIAYAVHDLEDGLAFRNFTIDELLYLIKKQDTTAFDQLNDIVAEAREYAGNANTYGTIQEYSQVFRKKLTSELTNKFINDVTIGQVTTEEAEKNGTVQGQYELQLGDYRKLCGLLSKTIFKCMTREPNVSIYERRGEIILQDLYKVFADEVINKDGKMLPPDYRPNDGYPLQKCCIDYLAGMMDTFAISTYKDIYGIDFENIPLKDSPKVEC